MEKQFYTIKEVAERTGMSAHTLRYYDKKGLLTFVRRSESGIRLFTEEDFDALYTIYCLKECGMSLSKIREFMELYNQGNETIEARGRFLEEQKIEVENQIRQLEEMLEIINYKCWFFQEAKKHGDVYYYKKMDPGEYPAIMKNFFHKVQEFRDLDEEESAEEQNSEE